jgi:uncharacterized protein YbbC (DUF1343 family)
MRIYKIFIIFLFFITFIGCTVVDDDNNSQQEEYYILSDVTTVEVGKTLKLVTNLENPTWESDDESVATINTTGNVTGLTAGEVKIKATSGDDFVEIIITVIKTTEDEVTQDKVLLGIDRIDDYLDIFEGKRVGLITNQTGLNSNYESTVDILFKKVNLVALFAPEHGIRGEHQAGDYISSYKDEKTNLTVYSLYGSTPRPTKEMMDKIDIMCIDIQDAGARFYTYVYTMAYAMEECEKYGKEFVVFDRPNPAGGHIYEGNILELQYRSFVGWYPTIQRHGMTIGELAKLFNEEYEIGCNLQIVPMKNWKREMFYDDTALPWVIPSPNFPSIETALVYPGTCIFEGTNLSEGRGTTIPFQVIGAPFIDANKWCEELNKLNLEGVAFRPAYFIPTFSKNQGKLNAGVQVHVTNRETFNAVKVGYAMLEVVRDLYPNQVVINTSTMNRLSGTNYISNRTYSLEELFNKIDEDTKTFGLIRQKYLLY